MRIILVGCVEKKAIGPHPPAPWPKDYEPKWLPAKDLYVSPLWQKRRAYAEREVAEGRAQHWAILSALHNCIHPDFETTGYDFKMSEWGKAWLGHWGDQAVISLRRDVICGGRFCDKKPTHQDKDGVWRPGYVRCSGCLDGAVVEIHAGVAYVDPIRAPLEAAGATVETPLAGLQIGEQLHWYKVELDPQLALCEAA